MTDEVFLRSLGIRQDEADILAKPEKIQQALTAARQKESLVLPELGSVASMRASALAWCEEAKRLDVERKDWKFAAIVFFAACVLITFVPMVIGGK